MAIVFIPEGIQKFLFASILGSGRFLQIGIPYPNILGPFIGVVEIACGILILFGLFTRLASLVLIFDMIVAIISTKIPILLGHDWWIFHVPALPRYGFWSMMHEIRPDITMLLGSIYLLIRGAGVWSFDANLSRKFCTG
jgi:putative oxidoreductase